MNSDRVLKEQTLGKRMSKQHNKINNRRQRSRGKRRTIKKIKNKKLGGEKNPNEDRRADKHTISTDGRKGRWRG